MHYIFSSLLMTVSFSDGILRLLKMLHYFMMNSINFGNKYKKQSRVSFLSLIFHLKRIFALDKLHSTLIFVCISLNSAFKVWRSLTIIKNIILFDSHFQLRQLLDNRILISFLGKKLKIQQKIWIKNSIKLNPIYIGKTINDNEIGIPRRKRRNVKHAVCFIDDRQRKTSYDCDYELSEPWKTIRLNASFQNLIPIISNILSQKKKKLIIFTTQHILYYDIKRKIAYTEIESLNLIKQNSNTLIMSMIKSLNTNQKSLIVLCKNKHQQIFVTKKLDQKEFLFMVTMIDGDTSIRLELSEKIFEKIS